MGSRTVLYPDCASSPLSLATTRTLDGSCLDRFWSVCGTARHLRWHPYHLRFPPLMGRERRKDGERWGERGGKMMRQITHASLVSVAPTHTLYTHTHTRTHTHTFSICSANPKLGRNMKHTHIHAPLVSVAPTRSWGGTCNPKYHWQP